MRYKLTPLQKSGNKQIADTYAILGLLNEYNNTDIKMDISRACRGRANIKLNHFTVPIFAFNKGAEFSQYYVIHEYTHIMGKHYNHDSAFKRLEQILLSLFDLTLDYAKAYPKAIYANGQKVYERKNLQRIAQSRR